MKETEEKSGTEAIVSLILLPFIVMLHTWVFMKLWVWFIVPVFHTPALPFWQAMGVSLVVGFLQPLPKNNEPLRDKIILQITRPLIALTIGGIILLFI